MTRSTRIIAAILMTVSLSCASTFNRDSRIQTRVDQQIQSTMSGHRYSTTVSVNHGIVTLTGRAASEEDRRMIGDTANKVEGVKSVINNVVVDPRS